MDSLGLTEGEMLGDMLGLNDTPTEGLGLILGLREGERLGESEGLNDGLIL